MFCQSEGAPNNSFRSRRNLYYDFGAPHRKLLDGALCAQSVSRADHHIPLKYSKGSFW
jgi:hypothetical protein